MERFTELVVETEPQQRTMLRLSLEADDEARRQLLLRQGRAIEWLKEALAPLREAMSDDDLHRLVVAIRSAIGIEAFVWLVDVAGLDRAAATASMRWSASALLQAALRGARALGSSPRRLCRSVMDDLKLGLQLGYWTAQPPDGPRAHRDRRRRPRTLGFDSAVDRRVVELGRVLAARLDRGAHTTPAQAGDRHRPDVGAQPGDDGDARA